MGSGARVTSDRDQMRREVRAGLLARPRTLPSKYFYDERGSELFDAITRLPEYYLTRAERGILTRIAPVLAADPAPRTLVELGAGSADKTRVLLRAMAHGGRPATYVPIDVSADFLARAAARLRAEFPTLTVLPVAADFSADVPLPAHPAPALHAFLGSTIGNFDAPDAIALLARTAARMGADDAFLLGADLRKDPAMLERAYDDAAGVTAAFNRNILTVLDRELGADFDPARFRHRARYDATAHRIEMYLDAIGPQTVHIPGMASITLAEGESIRTEVSYKYDRDTLRALLTQAGLRLVRWETDDAGLFALALARRA